MNSNQQKVIHYYSALESKLGFDFLLWGSKHFGYYPSGKANISEKEAQVRYQEELEKRLEPQSGQRLLDAGCGQGIVSTFLASRNDIHVTGITLIPFEIRKARIRAQRMGVMEKTDYQLMDYSSTNFPNDHFDAVYATETLSHAPDIRKTLTEFFRILKPGGRVVFFEYTIAPENVFSLEERRVRDLVIEGSAMFGLKEFRHDAFPGVMEGIGFSNVTEENITDHIQPSFYRLHKLSVIPYQIIRLLRLQPRFINTVAGYEYYKMSKKGLFRHCIFVGNKPG